MSYNTYITAATALRLQIQELLKRRRVARQQGWEYSYLRHLTKEVRDSVQALREIRNITITY
jgi:hypothetical protein